MSEPGRGRRLVWLGWSLVIALAGGARGLRAQDEDVVSLQQRCRGENPQLEVVCGEAALTFQAAQGALGLFAAGGAQVPGAASTLGRRFGGTPRFSLALRGSAARVGTPDFEDGTPTGGGAGFGFGARATLGVGLLDGFTLLPTVGGILSLDLFASAGVFWLPDGRGFEGGSASYGVGARVGLLRESFTLPGLTLSLARHGVGDVRIGSRDAGDAIEVRVDPTVTSVRGLIGKDLLHLGVLAGVGWDRYSGGGALSVGESALAVRDFESSRVLWFGGASLNLLLLQLAAEVGWAGGLDGLAEGSRDGYDPTGGSLFLSVAARLTL